MENNIIIETVGLRKSFRVKQSNLATRKKELKAVDGISLKIPARAAVGLVGESGCGKSTFGRTVLNLIPPSGGEILFNGKKLDTHNKAMMREFRRNCQIIFQDPYASLNPRRTILDSVKFPLEVYKIGTEEERVAQAAELLKSVGLNEQQIYKYPHALSGGQRQRAVIARAMILDPKFIVCDEPVSALDVSIRSQVLNLMKELQRERTVAYLCISHDLSVVRYLCDAVAVMYLGRILEYGDKKQIFDHPTHPYTKALMSAIPIPDVDVKVERIILQGDVPNPVDPPSGCCFRTRCPYATEQCAQQIPQLQDLGDGHQVACHRLREDGTIG